MKNLKTKVKLLASFLTIAVLTTIVGVVGIYGLSRMETGNTNLYYSNLLAISAMADFREAYQTERNQLRAMVLAVGDQNEVQGVIDSFAALEQTIKNAMTEYEKTITDEAQETDYYTAKNMYLGDYTTAKKNMIEAAKSGDFDLTYQLLKDAGPVVSPIVNGLNNSAATNDKWALETVDTNNSLSRTLTVVQVAVLVLAVAVALMFAFYISGLISSPLSLMSKALEQIGTKGDLSLDPEMQKSAGAATTRKDEIGTCARAVVGLIKHLTHVEEELQRVSDGDLTVEVKTLSDRDNIGISVSKVVQNLNNMFSEINVSTAQVSTGSRQIADGAQALAQGSTEQAASVQQLSSSISEIAQKTRANAEMAEKAAELATRIMGNAEKGSKQMSEMTAAVQEINQASQSINKVIKVIDDIAFQTNILALNAAVEAARAGQHGKGFAVVAEEVRNLAAKSAEAAKDTGSLIANSMEKAELGARIADETATSLNEIVSGINESALLVGDIAKSSEEQSTGISEINKGIDQVAQVVQQNSATAEQSAAASEEMSGQSDMLQNLVAQFKLRDDGINRFHSLPSSEPNPQKRLSPPERTPHISGGSGEGFGKY